MHGFIFSMLGEKLYIPAAKSKSVGGQKREWGRYLVEGNWKKSTFLWKKYFGGEGWKEDG